MQKPAWKVQTDEILLKKNNNNTEFSRRFLLLLPTQIGTIIYTQWYRFDSYRSRKRKQSDLLHASPANDEHQHVKQFGVVASLFHQSVYIYTNVGIWHSTHFVLGFCFSFTSIHTLGWCVRLENRAGQTYQYTWTCLLNTQTNYYFDHLHSFCRQQFFCCLLVHFLFQTHSMDQRWNECACYVSHWWISKNQALLLTEYGYGCLYSVHTQSLSVLEESTRESATVCVVGSTVESVLQNACLPAFVCISFSSFSTFFSCFFLVASFYLMSMDFFGPVSNSFLVILSLSSSFSSNFAICIGLSIRFRLLHDNHQLSTSTRVLYDGTSDASVQEGEAFGGEIEHRESAYATKREWREPFYWP